ncbi:MAG: DUF4397 domain-containing protein [Myxococcales bacterium]|nr:DUF4397 domain-containing protein [Myxococcales bacterium]
MAKRSKEKLFIVIVSAALAALALSLVACGGEQTDGANMASMRIVHGSFDGPPVNVIVDGNQMASKLPYAAASPYMPIAAGPHNLQVEAGGKILLSTMLQMVPGTAYTVYAVGSAQNISALISKEPNAQTSSTLPTASARLIHAAPDAPNVDIKLDSGNGPAVFSNVSYQSVTAYAEVQAKSYSFVVTAAGSTDAVVAFKPVALEAGKRYTIIALGTLDPNDKFDFKVRVFVDNGPGNVAIDLEPLQGGTPPPPPGTTNPRVRVIHASYDAPAVNVAVDGKIAISDLAYGKTSGYAALEAGKRRVEVLPASGGAAVIDAALDLAKDTDYTVFAIDTLANIAPLVLEDDKSVEANKARVRLVHASPDAPAVDIKVGKGDGPAVFSNAKFKDGTDYSSVDPGSYSFVITAAGQTQEVIAYQPVTLDAGKRYTVVALGTLDAKDKTDFVVRVFIDDGDGKTSLDLKVRPPIKFAKALVVHASPDAPGVDLLVDNSKVNTTPLTFTANTGYLDVQSGARNVKVNAAGTSTSVIDANLTLDPNKSYSIFAINTLANIEALVLEDDLSTPSAGKAHLRFAHLSPDAPAVDIWIKGSPAPIFTNMKFKGSTTFIPVKAGTYAIEVKLAGTHTTVLESGHLTLDASGIYTVWASGLVGNGTLGAELIRNK